MCVFIYSFYYLLHFDMIFYENEGHFYAKLLITVVHYLLYCITVKYNNAISYEEKTIYYHVVNITIKRNKYIN